MVNNHKNSQHSPASSNSDLNSSGSDNDESEGLSLKFTNGHGSYLRKEKEHDVIDDLHQKMVQRMKIAPPAPPKSRSSHV